MSRIYLHKPIFVYSRAGHIDIDQTCFEIGKFIGYLLDQRGSIKQNPIPKITKMVNYPKLTYDFLCLHFYWAYFVLRVINSQSRRLKVQGIAKMIPQINIKKQQNRKTGRKSARKVEPLYYILPDENANLKDRVWALQEQNCLSIGGEYRGWMNLQHSWIHHEYFYSHCEHQFYHDDTLDQIIKKLSIQPMTHGKFRSLQKSLPVPCLFDSDFVQAQKQRLALVKKQKAMRKQRKLKIEEYLKEMKLTVGTTVWALHPGCGHLHPGTLLTQYKDDIFVIKFHNPLLGTVKVSEELISADFMRNQTLNRKQKKVGSQSHIKEIDQLDLQPFTIFRSILQIKGALLHSFKSFHDLAEQRNTQGIGLDEEELQLYGWVGSMIALINILLKYLQANFQIFQTNCPSQHKGSKLPILDLSERYAGPLNPSEQMNDPQNDDPQNQPHMAGQQGRQQIVELIYNKYKPLLNSNQEPTQFQQTKILLKKCLSVLCGLQQEGKSYNPSQDKFLNSYQGSISDQFQKINQHVKEVTHKLQ